MAPRSIDHSNSTSSSSLRDADDAMHSNKNKDTKMERPPMLAPTTVLCVLVLIDMFSVSLVVPLLHQYYQNAGVHSASQREMLSSLYSSSQIAGGLVIGALSDVGILSRRQILFLSFLGSALSYGFIAFGDLKLLIFSRVLVGLVKQTMTVSTSLLARYTTTETRAVFMGRLSATLTAAWIAGPSVGALLYKHVGPSAPALTASGLFLLNAALAALLLPADDETGDDASKSTKQNGSKRGGSKFASFTTNLKTCFSSSALASAVIAQLLFGWVTRTTSYASMASFYEEKYSLQPHFRGYIKSYQQLLNFAVQTFFLRALLKALGGERKAACIAAGVLALATLCEVHSNFEVFVIVVSPAVAISVAMISVSLRSLVTQVAPKESLGSVLAALDVLQNAASVTVPFYRTLLFNLVAYYGEKDSNAIMVGDPEPRLWLLSSFVHWSFFAVAMALLLAPAASVLRGKSAQKKDQ